MYKRYPMVAYVNLKQDDSIYSPKLRAHHEKSREEMKARMQKIKADEAKALDELKAKYPKMFDDVEEQQKQAGIHSELYRRVHQEELERLKTLQVVRRNPAKELYEYVRFKFYVIRHFGLRYKNNSIKFGPKELGDFGRQK